MRLINEIIISCSPRFKKDVDFLEAELRYCPFLLLVNQFAEVNLANAASC